MAKRKRPKYEYEVAPDIQARLEEIVRLLPDEFPHVDVRRVICYRSRGAKARIYARIWALPGIISHALGIEPHYVVEFVEAFDRAKTEDQDRTILHELLHIPKTFSGALVPHKCFGKSIDCAAEGRLYKKLEIARGLEARLGMARPLSFFG